MKSLTVSSPAKINLYLKVIRKRPDGYHELYTLFHRISLKDTIRLKKSASGLTLQCSNPKLSRGEDNLICRAYRALQKEYPKLGGVCIHLKKEIPIGAGLGGGSGNAAATLLALKSLFRLPISMSRLAKIGAKLGADVPFFIHNINQAIGLGIGDRIHPKPAKRRSWFVLAISDKGLSTPTVYKGLPRPIPAPFLTKVSRAVTMLCDFLEVGDFLRLSQVMENDLEASAFRLRPSLRVLIERLNRLGAPAVRMSGSGPTVFAVFRHSQTAQKFAQKLRKVQPTKKIIVCHTY